MIQHTLASSGCTRNFFSTRVARHSIFLRRRCCGFKLALTLLFSCRRRDDRRTSEWALDQDMISKREARERSRRQAEVDSRGNRSE